MSDWMSEATRRIALDTPTPEIVAEARPEKWRISTENGSYYVNKIFTIITTISY